jgi:hypothetical protein
VGEKQDEKPAAAACMAGVPGRPVGAPAGYGLPTAPACPAGGGPVAARVARDLLTAQRPVRGA